jgi:hypothetical protein
MLTRILAPAVRAVGRGLRCGARRAVHVRRMTDLYYSCLPVPGRSRGARVSADTM